MAGGIFYSLVQGGDLFLLAFALSFCLGWKFFNYYYFSILYNFVKENFGLISSIIWICFVICLVVYLSLDTVYASTIEGISNNCNTGENSTCDNINTPNTHNNHNTPNTQNTQVPVDKETYKFSMEVDKKVGDAVGEVLRENISKAIDTGLSKIAAGAGIGAAAGAVGAAVVKSNLPLGPKIGMLAACSAVTAASVKVGMDIGTAITEKRVRTEQELIKIDLDRAPSPVEGFISSLMDTGDISSPLQDLLNAQVKISILLFVSILLAIIIVIYKIFSYYSSSQVSLFLT